LGSDGLFDNLYDDEILEEVQNCIDQQADNSNNTECDEAAVQLKNTTASATIEIAPQTISDALAHRAKVVSEDPDNPSSPFQIRAMHEGLYYQVTKKKKVYAFMCVF
jgi:hypothetical protein